MVATLASRDSELILVIAIVVVVAEVVGSSSGCGGCRQTRASGALKRQPVSRGSGGSGGCCCRLSAEAAADKKDSPTTGKVAQKSASLRHLWQGSLRQPTGSESRWLLELDRGCIQLTLTLQVSLSASTMRVN